MNKAGSAQSAAGTGLRPAYAATRAHLALVAVLFALAGVGWWWTIRLMRGMDNGPWTGLGTFGWFIGVWVVMMAAMMLPIATNCEPAGAAPWPARSSSRRPTRRA